MQYPYGKLIGFDEIQSDSLDVKLNKVNNISFVT